MRYLTSNGSLAFLEPLRQDGTCPANVILHTRASTNEFYVWYRCSGTSSSALLATRQMRCWSVFSGAQEIVMTSLSVYGLIPDSLRPL